MSVVKIKNDNDQWVGIPTINGKSAYAYAVDGGYTGTEAEFALKLAQEGVTSVNGRTGAVTGLKEQTTVVNKTASDTSQTLEANKFYIFPEMSTLTITCPSTGGEYAFRFTSGATATTLTMTGITMPDGFTVEANRVYEINVYQGYGLAVSWEVTV